MLETKIGARPEKISQGRPRVLLWTLEKYGVEAVLGALETYHRLLLPSRVPPRIPPVNLFQCRRGVAGSIVWGREGEGGGWGGVLLLDGNGAVADCLSPCRSSVSCCR